MRMVPIAHIIVFDEQSVAMSSRTLLDCIVMFVKLLFFIYSNNLSRTGFLQCGFRVVYVVHYNDGFSWIPFYNFNIVIKWWLNILPMDIPTKYVSTSYMNSYIILYGCYVIRKFITNIFCKGSL